MAKDRYSNFDQLRKHETLDKDYRISTSDLGSDITIIAPHGGKIEPRTSEIAREVAKGRYNFYSFEGIKGDNNGSLHITSHNFDEPKAIELLSRSSSVIAIHACTGTDSLIYLGGLDKELEAIIAEELKDRGIGISKRHARYKGLHTENICNRSKTNKGVQLEITRDLRDDPQKVHLICEAIRAALVKISRD